MLQVEGGPVVDHPEPLMPDQQVRVPCGPVHVGCRASSQTMSAASSGSACHPFAGGYAAAPGRKSTPRLEPGLARMPLYRGIRLAEPSAGSTSTMTCSGTGMSRARASSPTITSAISAQRSLPGAGELHDIQAVVVGLHESRQRPALAQRRHVARGRHAPQLARGGMAGTLPGSSRVGSPRRRRRVPRPC